jgi:hypothetical protein
MSLKPFAEAYMRVRPKSWMPSTVLLGTIWASPALTRPSGAARVRQAAILYELYRNGIIHGTLLNYDNDVVATRAWNRLFAVVDWAKARTKEQQPPRAEPTWWEVFAQLADNARKERAAKEWKPETLVPTDAGFTTHPVYLACEQLFTYWRQRNYGRIATLLSKATQDAYGAS